MATFSVSPDTLLLTSKTELSTSSKALVVFDGNIDDLPFLLGNLPQSANIVVLNPAEDGVEQITLALESYQSVSSLHLVSHGTPGCLHLGSTQLNFGTLNDYANQLKAWAKVLKGQDILIYGCQVAKGALGHLFLQQLHQLTGANLAASEQRVGRADSQINWVLETQLGTLTTPVIFSETVQQSYQGAFDPEVSLSLNTDTLIETEAPTLSLNFTLSELPPPEGTVVTLTSDEDASFNRYDLGFGLQLEGIDGFPTDVSPSQDFSAFQIVIVEQNASLSFPIVSTSADSDLNGDGVVEDFGDSPETVTYSISVDSGGSVSPGNGSASVTIFDNPDQIVVSEPEISLTSDITELVEDEGTEVTLTFSLDVAPPSEGLSVDITTGKAFALGDFDIFAPPPQASATGGRLVGANADNSGFTFSITEQTATITLPIFDDPDRVPDGTVTNPDDELRNDDQGEEQTTFTIQPGDGYTVASGANSVTLTLKDTNFVNTDPEAGNDSYETEFEEALTINAPGVLSNDSDEDGDSLSVAIDSEPSNGSVDLSADGSFTYTPDAGFSGNDSFSYSVSDGNGGTDTATVTVNVADAPPPPNTPPVADDDSYSTDFETALTVNAANGVLDGDSDADGDPLTAAIETNPSNGSVSLNGDGSFTYTPDAGFEGSDSFTYSVSDGNGGTDTATVTVSVADAPPPPNTPPEADNDSYSTDFETALTVNAANGVLDGDTDADGDPLTAAIETNPSNGSVSLNGDGSFTYTPDAGFEGSDSFTYSVSDGNGGTDTATVTVSVADAPPPPPPENTPPEAEDDSYSTGFESPIVVDADAGVLDNDSDEDGDDLTVAIDSEPSNGSVDLSADGSFTYTPDDGFSGTDSFDYSVSDGNGGTDTATVTVSVDDAPPPPPPENTPPEAEDDSYSTGFESPIVVDADAGVLDNDSDADGDSLSVAIDSQPSNGSVDLSADGSFTYTPDAGFSGNDSFTYSVSDGEDSDTATVSVSVAAPPEPENTPPEAEDDSYSTGFESPIVVDADAGVLDNDSDADGDALTVAIDSEPSNGSVDLSEDGSFTYTPDAGFSGSDSFTYSVSDGQDSDTATVTVSVDDAPPPPPPEEPVVSFSTTPELINEAEGTNLVMNFSVEGEIPEEGITVNLEGDTAEILQQFLAPDGDGAVQTRVTDEGNILYRFDTSFEPDNDNFANVEGGILDVFALEDGDPAEDNSDPAAAGTGFLSNFSFTITEPTASITLPVSDDLVQEADQTFTYTLVDGEGYEVDDMANSGTFTVTDGVPGGVGPTVGVTAEPTDLIEQEQTVLTVTFDTVGDIPAEGLVVQLKGSPRSIAEFDVNATNPRLPEEETVVEGVNVVGGNIVGTDEVAGSLFLRIQEPTVTVTVPVFQDEVPEGPETFNFNLVDGEAYQVDPNASDFTITIDDPVIEPTVPEVSVSITPDQVTEESPNNATTTTFTVDGEIPTPEFDGDGNLISGGLSVFLDIKEIDVLGNQFDDFSLDGVTFGPLFNPGQSSINELILLEETSSLTLTILNDVIEEEPFTFNFELLADQDGTDYTVNPDANMGSFELIDGNGGPGIGPDVSISTTASELAEGEEFTVNFEVDGDIPEGGLTVLVDSPTPGALGEFTIFDEEGNPAVELEGIDGFPTVGDAGGSSFLVNIVEPEASLTLSVFDDGPGEGTEELTFDLVNGEVYEVDSDASGFTLTIEEDVPDVPVVSVNIEPDVVSEEDENRLATVTINVDGVIPEGGLSVLLDGGDALALLDQVDGAVDAPLENIAVGEFFDPATNVFEIILLDNQAIAPFPILNDVVEEADRDFAFTILPDTEGVLDSDYVVDPNASTDSVTLIDENGGPGVGPTVSISATASELAEGDEFSVNFEVDGEIPEGGVTVLVDSPTPGAIGEFTIFDEEGNPAVELVGIDGFPTVGDGGGSSFLVNIVEPSASLTLSVFDDGPNEGQETFTFDLINGEVYEVDSDASSISLTINDFEIIGSPDADEIVGDDADNSIDASAGDDVVAGGLGNDTMLGGEGEDVLRGDANSRSSSTGVGGDDVIFGGAGNDRIGGKDGNDLLSGDEGDDQIWGDAGDDTIMGVTGNDILTGDDNSGGSGSDVFVFGNGDGTDTITDFEVGTDFIGLVEGELTFEALEIIEIDGNAAISVTETGETLAVLNGVGSDELTPEMFVITPDVSSLEDLV